MKTANISAVKKSQKQTDSTEYERITREELNKLGDLSYALQGIIDLSREGDGTQEIRTICIAALLNPIADSLCDIYCEIGDRGPEPKGGAR